LRLERALDNLVSNAIKYSPRGGRITIEISAEQPDVEGLRATSHGRTASPRPPTPDTNAVIIVRDEGMGIPAEDLPHIFDWFHRATNVSGRISGTGIGLATVRQTVEQHGGSITVKSVEGKGTTFTLRLPLSPPTTPDH